MVILEKGGVLTGKVLKQDDDGVLIQMESGTHRYPRSWIKEVKKEPAAAPHVSNNGQRIPDWAQIVTLLANTKWSDGLKQVPATMIETGIWKNVPYISFQCQYAGYELNIFGDLGKPAAVQIGAMSFLKNSDEARSNCVSLICSVLANADDRKMVRALSWQQKDVQKNKGMTFETVMPGEWGSYGGWWVSVYSEDALAASRASDEELLTFTQPAVRPTVAAPQPVVANAQPAAATAGAVDQSGAAPPPPAATATSAAANHDHSLCHVSHVVRGGACLCPAGHSGASGYPRLLGDLFLLRLHPPRCIHGPMRAKAEPTVNRKPGGDRPAS